MTLIALKDFEIDLGGIINYVYQLDYYEIIKTKQIIKIGPLAYEPDLLLSKPFF